MNSKRISKQDTKDILWGEFSGSSKSDNLSQAILKYLGSEEAQAAESYMINASKKEPLTNDQWVKSTRYLVTRIQVIHGTRMEAQDMTVKEWENRKDVNGPPYGLVKIEQKFTKLEGKNDQPTILVLGLVDTALCIAYEMAKMVKFPGLMDQPHYRASSFFLNSAGKTYADHHGNPLHLTDWCRITGREDTVSSFRSILSGYSLSTDDTNRANLAFANNHSEATMTRIYAHNSDKVLAGISALLRYREDQLGQTAASNLPVTKIKIPKEVKERQKENRGHDWDQIRSDSAKTETVQNKLDSARKGGPANDDSRASLIELCAAEIKTGSSVNNVFLADILLRKPKLYMKIAEKVGAILRVMDSFEFAHQMQSITLQEFLIEEARRRGPKASDDINDDLIVSIEQYVIGKCWIQGQMNKMGNPGIKLTGFRIPAALMDIATTTGKSYYCIGSNLIAKRVSNMVRSRKNYVNGNEEDDEEQEDALSPRSIVQLSRKTAANPSSPTPTNSPRSLRYQLKLLEASDSQTPSTPKRKTSFKTKQILVEHKPKGETSKTLQPTTSDSSSDEDVLQKGQKRRNPWNILDSSSSEEDGPEENLPRGVKRKYAGSSTDNKDLQKGGERTQRDSSVEEQDHDVQMVLLEQAKMMKAQTVLGRSGRLKHWTKEERVNLLVGVLAWMEDPTWPYQEKGKTDLRQNVSPRVTENRPHESVQDQYYRTGSPTTGKDSMYNWLENYVANSPEIEWNVESLRKHQKIICDAYKAQYTRKC